MHSRKQRFTLIELLAVMFLLSILAALVIGGARFAMLRSSEASTISAMKKLELALEQYRNEYGYFPVQTTANTPLRRASFGGDWVNQGTGVIQSNRKAAEALGSLKTSTNGLDATFTDGFGNPFYYRTGSSADVKNKSSYDLWSMGADGTQPTADDITNWTAN